MRHEAPAAIVLGEPILALILDDSEPLLYHQVLKIKTKPFGKVLACIVCVKDFDLLRKIAFFEIREKMLSGVLLLVANEDCTDIERRAVNVDQPLMNGARNLAFVGQEVKPLEFRRAVA